MSFAQRALLAGSAVTATVTEGGLDVGGRVLSWLDVDGVAEGDHRVRLELADRSSVLLTGLGATHDRFLKELREARRRVRLPALTVATGEPIDSFVSRAPTGWLDVHVFAKVLVAEPREGPPTAVPLPLVERVERAGHTLTVVPRGLAAVSIMALGARTDEFVNRVADARRDLQAAVAAAYVTQEPALAGFGAPDGWAVDRAASGVHWPALRALALGGARGAEVAHLESLAGDRLAVGLYTDGGARCLPFVLAPVGGRVAVEAIDSEARATYVFETTDLARLNAVLLLTSFRREALFLPDDEMGRWAVAARVWPVVREARASLVARVVHDGNWAAKVSAALP